jgi:hypothetical protein
LEFDEPIAVVISVTGAVERFLAEQASRGTADSTLKSFRKFLPARPTRFKFRSSEKFSPTLVETSRGRAVLNSCLCHYDVPALEPGVVGAQKADVPR